MISINDGKVRIINYIRKKKKREEGKEIILFYCINILNIRIV